MMAKFFALLFLASCAQFKGKFNPVENNRSKHSLLWAKNLDPDYRLGNLPVGWSAPLIHLDKIYIGTQSGQMNIYDLTSGRLLKSYQEPGRVVMKPWIKDGKLFYGTSEGSFIVRSLSDGKIVYQEKFQTPLEAQLTSDDDVVFFRLRNHALIAFNYKTKKIAWRYQRSSNSMTSLNRIASATIVGDKVISGFADGYLVALGKTDGKLLWESKLTESNKFVDIDMNPLIIGNRLWIGSLSGSLFILSTKSGQTLRRIESRVLAKPILIGKSVYALDVKGELIKADLDGNILKKLKVSDSGITSSVLWKGKYIAASNFKGKLIVVNTETMKSSPLYDFGYRKSSLLGELESKNNYLAAYSTRNRLYIFK